MKHRNGEAVKGTTHDENDLRSIMFWEERRSTALKQIQLATNSQQKYWHQRAVREYEKTIAVIKQRMAKRAAKRAEKRNPVLFPDT